MTTASLALLVVIQFFADAELFERSSVPHLKGSVGTKRNENDTCVFELDEVAKINNCCANNKSFFFFFSNFT